jgi:hypothetical protein
MTIILIIIAAATVYFWFSAGSVYDSHRKTRENHPTLFKITGMNERYLHDRARWIWHFRIQTVLAAAFFLVALLAIFLRAGSG